MYAATKGLYVVYPLAEIQHGAFIGLSDRDPSISSTDEDSERILFDLRSRWIMFFA